MSYSEAITRESLTNILNEVLPVTSKVELEYVGTVNQIHWSEWVAPDDGIVVMDIGWLTGGGFGYYYVKDATANLNVGKVTTYSINGTSNTTSFPVIKGHTYKDAGLSGVNGSAFYFLYYKFKNPTATCGMEDFIVEQGTATPDSYGTWTYRKWNSGVAECWRDLSTASFAPATAVGGFYGRVLSPYLFPTDLFIETPKGFFNLSSWGTGYFWGQMRLTSATTYQLALWRNDNAGSAATGSIYAIGRWK